MTAPAGASVLAVLVDEVRNAMQPIVVLIEEGVADEGGGEDIDDCRDSIARIRRACDVAMAAPVVDWARLARIVANSDPAVVAVELGIAERDAREVAPFLRAVVGRIAPDARAKGNPS